MDIACNILGGEGIICHQLSMKIVVHIIAAYYLIQNSQTGKKRVPPKCHGEIGCEIQVGGQEMAVMV